jgi:predicted PurR-regulated permease PerM
VKDFILKNRYLIIFTLSLVILFILAYVFRGALFPFIVGLVVAHLVMPVILRIEKRLPVKDKWLRTKRVSLILGFFILVLIVAGAIGFYVITALIDAATDLFDSAPEFFISAFTEIEEWFESIGREFPTEFKQQLDEFVQDAGVWLGEQTQILFTRTISLIPATIGFIFGLSFLPIFLFYVLKDWEKLGKGFYEGMPDWAEGHMKNVVSIIDNVLVRYFRAQIVLGLIVGTMAFIGLMGLGVEYAGVLAVFAGVTEMIPIVGPWIGGAVAVIVTLATAPDKAIWVAIIFIAIQLLENAFLVAKIQSAYLRIHPAIVIALLAIGAKLAGFWGILLVVPLTATIVEIFRYIRKTAASSNAELEQQA